MNIRQYKKKYLICKDDFGKNIYVGDTVELYCPIEVKSPWTSIVCWSMLHGAWVDSHSAHRALSQNPEQQRMLYNLIGQEEWNICTVGEDIPTSYKGYCKKIKSFNKK